MKDGRDSVGTAADLHARSTTGDARPSHRYSLSDLGLTGEEVDERFAGYRWNQN